MDILITGGGGFIGSHLCRRLVREGHRVVCIDNFSTGHRENLAPVPGWDKISIIEADVCDPILADLPRFDEIYHLACPASPRHYQADPVATMRTCSVGTHNVLDRARRDDARLFHASTSEIYGDPAIHPQVESYTGNVHTIGPRACYDEGKRFAESLMHAYSQQYGVAAKIARLFNTYGPRMRFDDGRLISNIVAQAILGEDITVYGDGSHTRSLCYVDDTVEGIIKLCRSSLTTATPVNLGNPAEMQVIDIAHAVRAATGSRSTIRFLPLPVHDPARRQPSIDRAAALLDWRPTIKLAEGLQRTIADFEIRLGGNRTRRSASA